MGEEDAEVGAGDEEGGLVKEKGGLEEVEDEGLVDGCVAAGVDVVVEAGLHAAKPIITAISAAAINKLLTRNICRCILDSLSFSDLRYLAFKPGERSNAFQFILSDLTRDFEAPFLD